ncbi:MAG: hypothetical protein HY681_11815 [Chloroflexi bacterium]|nr:hypothetical protein [Chloroflexota bacterium]
MTTKKKIGTVLDEELLRRAKMTAAKEGIPLSVLLGRALEAYLRPGKGDIVAETWGIMKADTDIVKRIMEEEESYLDT